MTEVGEKVGDAEDRVILVLADGHGYRHAVLERDDAVDGKREGDPLIFLDAAVVAGVERDDLVLLLERVLLDVETRGVDVGAEDVDAVLERLRADLDEHEALVTDGGIYLVACDELPA